MKSPDEIKNGLECCNKGNCKECPYRESEHIDCQEQMQNDALAYIQQLEEREWDLFDLLSSAWHGKQYYSKQEDGSVYSRESCESLTFDQAIDEFAQSLTVALGNNRFQYGTGFIKGFEAAHPKWISVEDEPKQTSDYLVYVWVAYPDGIAQMEMRKAIYNIVHKEWYVDCGRLEAVGKPTHWMHLPCAPKEEA